MIIFKQIISRKNLLDQAFKKISFLCVYININMSKSSPQQTKSQSMLEPSLNNIFNQDESSSFFPDLMKDFKDNFNLDEDKQEDVFKFTDQPKIESIIDEENEYQKVLFPHEDSCCLWDDLEQSVSEKVRDQGKQKSKNNLKTIKKKPRRGEKKKKSKKNKKKKPIKKVPMKKKTDTKNIPKNYGKEIIKFVKRNPVLVEKALSPTSFTYEELNTYLQSKRKQMTKIEDLKNLWIDNEQNLYGYPLRIITENFLRKHALNWIFNSRIEDRKAPIKYRITLREGARNPESFAYLKSY